VIAALVYSLAAASLACLGFTALLLNRFRGDQATGGLVVAAEHNP
jgi:hypothetical protein